ncbi:hypothetical protein [Hymenobacter psychrotolerans]|uniref:YXWGXW repeat-containing protein n=1 Tax=Hymenobacter psychrotolerans DSM 18569 TaxID=1121959 RepID=A0A1M6Z509_9BACT|nr:hypothetical protein [Hymenobacter psychrotolerans]SHL25571.1 hypothetical protein SAMN02746009_02426 [Hymenobacter psychrotolerans DSM 18569]
MRALLSAALLSGMVIVFSLSGPVLAQPPPDVRPTPEKVAYLYLVQAPVYLVELTALVMPVVPVMAVVPVPAQPAAPTSAIQGVGQIDGPKFRGPPRLVGRKKKVHGRWYKFYHIKGKRRADLHIDPGRRIADQA